jgi:exopolysaccharide production protein ExoZ
MIQSPGKQQVRPPGFARRRIAESEMADSKRFFPGVHALRGLAAILVVIEHAGYVWNDYTPLGFAPFGVVGVVLFFAISGFVIALQRAKPVITFIRHRVLRIYPSYWLAMIVAAAALASLKQPVSAIPSSILLFPSGISDSSLTIPYWTLAFEMTFYALAAVAFASRISDRILTTIAILWIALVNVVALAPTVGSYTFPGLPSILWSPATQVFPMGIICGIHFERLKRLPRWIFPLACLVAFILSFPFSDFSSKKLLFLGLAASCLILTLADLDIRTRSVLALGDASYGIYLMHFPAMIFAAHISRSHSFMWFFTIGIAAGYIFGLIDCRLYRRLIPQPVTRTASAY